MKPHSLRKIFVALAAAACLAQPAMAEDLDLFTSPAPTSTADAPNILIILDNSANWARNDQGWPLGKQGESELKALAALMADPNIGTNVNLGLMMFGSGAPADGGYVRFHIRSLTPVVKNAFIEMIGTAACVDGPNSLTGGANCILKNFNSSSEKINSASTRYSSVLFEAFKYFGGWTDPSNANTNLSPNPPNVVNTTHFGRQRYAVLDAKADRDAFTDGSRTVYAPPIALPPALPGCGKNYIVFIGNGYPSSDDPSQTLLTGIFGDAAVPAPIGNKANRAANWAKYLNLTDVAEAAGKQNVKTYTIDVFKDHPDGDQTSLMRAMAKFGGGKYFEAKSEDAILNALRDIIIEIQAVNSVFASASLPINATNRSQNENQVFIGMFRPDADALPRWYGNLKQFQIALFGGDAKLSDKNGAEAIAASTGFVQACAASFWTTDSGSYWSFSPASAGTCSSVAGSTNSDLPDGGVVEKGGAAEVVRKGNLPALSGPLGRKMLTCASFPCSSLVPLTDTIPSQARTGAVDATEHKAIVNHTLGFDVNNENGNESSPGVPITNEPRPSIHADIAHSRPLPVNFTMPSDPPGTNKVIVYYGANDGVFRAVEGKQIDGGRELWSFVAPEHHGKLKRLYKNDPIIAYPISINPPTAIRKDYFFDGSAGLYQNADNSEVWIFPTMRRGGRSIYAFDVSGASSAPETQPTVKWSVGCPNLTDDTDCTSGMSDIGQTWSNPNPAFIKGYAGGTKPVVILGGGYDACEDTDAAVTTCTSAAKGRRVYILDARDGSKLGPAAGFPTDRPVAADVTLIDRDFDGLVDHVYVADVGGGLYRIDLVDITSSPSPFYAPLAPSAWTITKIAQTSSGNRKFLFGAAALVANNNVFLAIGSGDRERPLITNYPYTTPVTNRFYMFIDKFPIPGTVNLDGGTMSNFTANTSCTTALAAGQDGWFMDLNAGQGEQIVTSSVIFGGTVFFSTNRPVAATPGTCASNLGEARGYAVNLLNASGVIGTGKLCGGGRSGVFTGGGLPPSPVVGTVPVALPGGGKKMINVLIGGINLDTGGGSVIGAQEPPVPIKQIRSRIYWYPHGDK